eukprot:168920_1
MRMYKVLKENQNNIVRLKQLSPNGKIPSGVLSGGASAIEKAISSFNAAKGADRVNEALPNANKNKKSKTPKKQKGPIFFKKNMDTSNDNTNQQQNKSNTQQNGGTTTKRRKMTITKENAPPPSKPTYGSQKKK